MKNPLNNKNILIGVTGGIAAYKVAELIRIIRNKGAETQVVMTEHAKRFITPLTLQTLSGRPTYSDLFDANFENDIGHIRLARWVDAILIAPASANFIARLSQGIANDLLTTLCLATTAPIILAPAMNKCMWDNPLTMDNVSRLKKQGVFFIGPSIGKQACGEEGMGRMVEPEELLLSLQGFFNENIFAEKKIVITAGPTHESIDPVRYISTRSTGNMGYAIAEAFANLGAQVCLISGPSSLACPHKVKKISVISAAEMHQAVMLNLPADIFIGAAAVSDYRSESPSPLKIKRGANYYSLNLIKNPDILAAVKNSLPCPFLVGFAAETDNHLTHAQEKLQRKDIDMIVLNSVENEQGFGPVASEVTILTKTKEVMNWPKLTKPVIANRLVELIAKKLSLI